MPLSRDDDDQPFDLNIKLLMLGDTGVGKTCLLLRYIHDSFSSTFITTIGIDFKIKRVVLDDQRLKLQIWDTAGQERFRTITVSYFKGAHGVVLVFDVSDRDSFESVRHWVTQIKEHAEAKCNVVLVGNKVDREAERVVSAEEGQALADEFGVAYFEASAKTNQGVDELYTHVARETAARLREQQEERRRRQEADILQLSSRGEAPAKGGRARPGCC